jgi:hypothetical protein
MSKNPNGGFSKQATNREWGRKARKADDRQRRRAARTEVINEQREAM